MSPFKKKAQEEPKAVAADSGDVNAAPEKTPEQVEAERTIARGERVKALSNEAAMWRSFATGCKSGRWIMEEYRGLYLNAQSHPRLDLSMDADSALLWKDFAIRMAEDRERRLRDVLGL